MNDVATLQELAASRRSEDRPTHVHVVGDLDQDPPKGIAAAKRVAALLAGEDGAVREEDFGELDDGDVAVVTIEASPRSQEAHEANDELYQLASVSRVKQIGGIVVLAEAVTGRVEGHLDARVWAKSGGVDRVDRLEVNPFERAVYSTELEGLR